MFNKMFSSLVILWITRFVYGANGITGPTSVPLSVQNPIADAKEAKIQEKRFSELKSGYLKGTAFDRDRDRYNSGLSRPDPIEHRYGVDSGGGGSRGGFITSYGGGHETRYPVTTTSYGEGNRDRISAYGHYGGGSYLDDGYDRRPYGPPQVVDINGYNPYGIHENGLHWGQQGYGHPGLNASPGQHWAKSAILPIAGAALLGLAAVLVANPVLLQLGVLSGRRRKRDIISEYSKSSQDIAYKGYVRR